MKKSVVLIFFTIILPFVGMAQVTYKDVAPIFYSRCTSCHNQYSHGASLLGYNQVQANKSTITAYLNSGYMPPWHPDTTYTRFAEEHIITQAEKTSILNWIASGAPAGDTTLVPSPPTYSRYQLNGVPSLELKIPTFVSNASTTDSHVSFALPTGLTQDYTIRAFEIVAGNPSIVHHVVVNIDTTGTQTSNTGGNCFSSSGILLGGYAPGGNPCVFPSSTQLKMGMKIKAGSNIMLNIHYPAGTAGQTDSTKIRLYFYPQNTQGIRPILTAEIKNNKLIVMANTIAPFSAQFPVSGSLAMQMSIFSVFPHSHYLCKSILSYAYTALDTIPLVKINNWDFDFQGYYTFRHLVKIPLSHTLYAKHTYDNTSNNPNNPNSPPINVYYGKNSSDEMLTDAFEYINYQRGDELINVDSLLSTDSLLATSIKQNLIFASHINNYAYPNPFQHTLTIAYTLDKAAKISIDIYNMNGICVKNLYNGYENEGTHQINWDGKNTQATKLNSGNYFYIIRVDGKPCIGKITLVN